MGRGGEGCSNTDQIQTSVLAYCNNFQFCIHYRLKMLCLKVIVHTLMDFISEAQGRLVYFIFNV